jgi:signal-transduction protein with cAMP-binding, CBS, and nucleotidyltransferase domain
MGLKNELRAEGIVHLDLSVFCLASSGTAVGEVVSRMRDANVNVCLITSGRRLIGILSDRDVLRKVAESPQLWDLPVDEVMTLDPITISLDASVADALWLMHEKRIRSLPAVRESGEIAGNMTYRALIDYLASRYPIEVLNLPPRPDQVAENVDGG